MTDSQERVLATIARDHDATPAHWSEAARAAMRELGRLRGQVEAHCRRIAEQSELLSRAAERPGEAEPPRHLSEAEVAAVWLEAGDRVRGLTLKPFRHRKTGNVYLLHLVALSADGCAPLALYAAEKPGPLWCRPLAEFLEKFECLEPPAGQGDARG